MSKANNLMDKLANAAKVKKYMAQGLSQEKAYQKAYPQQGPKDKGVIDPARPEMPKEAFFGAAAKALTGAGRVAAKVSKATSKATGKATRGMANKAGKELMRYGSKNQRVVRLPDGKLWHPNKAGLAATKAPNAFKRRALVGGTLAAGYLAGKRTGEKTGIKAGIEAARDVDAFKEQSIMPGQTLSEIAQQNQTTPAQLQEMNQIENADYIRAGESLRVPTNIIPPKLSPGVQAPQNPTNPTLKKQGSLSKEAFIGNFTKGLGYGAKYLKGLKGLQSAGKAVGKKAKVLDKQKGINMPDGRINPDAIKAHNKAVAESGKFPNKHIKGVGEAGKPGVAGKDFPLPKTRHDWSVGSSSAPVQSGNVGADPKFTHPLKELYKKWGLD